MSSAVTYAAQAGVIALRIAAVALVALAILIVAGALMAGMNVLSTAVLVLLALFGVAIALCCELAARGIRRYAGGRADG